jgi:hypothetical protein
MIHWSHPTLIRAWIIACSCRHLFQLRIWHQSIFVCMSDIAFLFVCSSVSLPFLSHNLASNISFRLLSSGACLLSGVGLPRDEVEALAHFARAAELNYAPAQYQIGICTRLRRWGLGAGVIGGRGWLDEKGCG